MSEISEEADVEQPLAGTPDVPNSVSKKLTQEDKQVIESANEILDSLEHVHRTDLALHLYSSFLLKRLLYRANDKKHLFEIDQLVKSQIKDNWVSWPNPNAVVDPQTDKIYEDLEFLDEANMEPPTDIIQNEVSASALQHASSMLHLELSSYWQDSLVKSSKKSGMPLDVDNMSIPTEFSTTILNKLDQLFSGLHQKMAKKNKVTVTKEKTPNSASTDVMTAIQIKNGVTKVNKQIQLNYHDIIERGYEMHENIDNIYMKSLELFNDVPNTFKKQPFKISKKVLKKYRNSHKGNKKSSSNISNGKDDYILLRNAVSDPTIPTEQRDKLRHLLRKQTELGLSQRTFYQVRGYTDDNDNATNGTPLNDIATFIKLRKDEAKTSFTEFHEPFKEARTTYDMRDYIVDLHELP
ncbi:Rrn9 protein [Maudiozyma humilis]|uniref:Rrn9 protein n=1 Tax=Maudiozyma humilis TaxID=51915 RepID=A0AAV5RZE4_MAUHU|nr:Rrn9 protein [Kazachstania humilis]